MPEDETDKKITESLRVKLTRNIRWPKWPERAIPELRLAKAPTNELLDMMDILSEFIETIEAEIAFLKGKELELSKTHEKAYDKAYLDAATLETKDLRAASARQDPAVMALAERLTKSAIYLSMLTARRDGLIRRANVVSRVLSARIGHAT